MLKITVCLSQCAAVISFLGKYYKLENETIEGLDILNIYTEQGKKRLIGNIVLENDFLNQKLSVLKITAEELTSVITHRSAELFTVTETMKNPVLRVLCIKTLSQHICTDRFLPKNPALCDYILTNAIKRKIPTSKVLAVWRTLLKIWQTNIL